MEWVKPDLWVIALDETSPCDIPDRYKGKLLGVQGIYVFDRDQEVHVADTSGSYELWLVMPREVISVAASADEALADEINNFVLGNYDYSEPVTYSYCREIDALLRRYAAGGAKHKHDFAHLGATPIMGWDWDVEPVAGRAGGKPEMPPYGYDWHDRSRFFEAVIRDLNANHPL